MRWYFEKAKKPAILLAKTDMRIIPGLIAVILIWCAVIQAQAQVGISTPVSGYYTLGINGGWSYQTSDIKAARGGFGFGATLARNLYQQPGAALSFDLRGRFLYARQYGLDPFRTYDIAGNTAIDGSRPQGLNYLTYPAPLGEPRGFAFLNHRTDLGELGLEGVFTLNRLRENTGIIFSLFGGIGIDGYRVAVDQAGAQGQPYYEGYSSIIEQMGRAEVRRNLRDQILDGSYETRADGFAGQSFKLGFMPSLGVELGYQLSPRFSAHLGHRVTFSRSNLLDGQQLEDSRNDLFHYTFFGLRWRLDRHRANRGHALAPGINIIAPVANPFTTSEVRGGQVRADIKHVNAPADINLYVNGQSHPFDYQNGRLQTNVPLRPGRNEVTISARNEAGTARESVIIIYQTAIDNPPPPPPPPPGIRRPRVAFDAPSGNNYRTSEPVFEVRARIEEVSNKADIEFTQNGSGRPFTFDTRAGVLRANIELRPGDNTLRIRARNEAGSDEATTTIRLEQRIEGPSVQITTPARSDETVNTAQLRLRATVKRAESRENISLFINGRENRNFEFDAARESLQTDLTLERGANRIELRVDMRNGSDQDEVRVTYEPPAQKNPPVVSFTRPNNSNSTTTKATADIEAAVSYINNKSQLTLLVNNQPISNFSFNANTGKVSATVNLVKGDNKIELKARNNDGSNEDQVVIKRTDVPGGLQLPPIITIQQPANGVTVSERAISVKAKIERVSERNDITFTVNGKRLYDFEFSSNNTQFSANLSLEEGNNTIRIQARNSAGSDDKQVSATYRPALQPPAVNVMQPADQAVINTAEAAFKAKTSRVSAKSEISLWLNDKTISNFQFNTSTQEVTANLTLQTGNNGIRIRVANAGGQDEKRIAVRYEQPKPPKVTILTPVNNSKINKTPLEVKATIVNVIDAKKVRFALNGKPVNNFKLDKENFSAELSNLQPGKNTIRLQADNADGSHEAAVTFSYEPPVAQPKPEVSFQRPAKSNTTTGESPSLIVVSVKNVDNKADIQLTVNKKAVTDFTFDAKTGEVKANVTLAKGGNTIFAEAKNEAGTAQATTLITYMPSAKRPPAIDITSISQPVANPFYPNNANSTVIASIKNVTKKDQIAFIVNGSVVTNFNFDVKTGVFEGIAPLNRGANTIVIRATNADGTDEAERTINF